MAITLTKPTAAYRPAPEGATGREGTVATTLEHTYDPGRELCAVTPGDTVPEDWPTDGAGWAAIVTANARRLRLLLGPDGKSAWVAIASEPFTGLPPALLMHLPLSGRLVQRAGGSMTVESLCATSCAEKPSWKRSGASRKVPAKESPPASAGNAGPGGSDIRADAGE